MKKSWTSHEKVVKNYGKILKQIVNKLWTIHEQVMNKSLTSFEITVKN